MIQDAAHCHQCFGHKVDCTAVGGMWSSGGGCCPCCKEDLFSGRCCKGEPGCSPEGQREEGRQGREESGEEGLWSSLTVSTCHIWLDLGTLAGMDISCDKWLIRSSACKTDIVCKHVLCALYGSMHPSYGSMKIPKDLGTLPLQNCKQAVVSQSPVYTCQRCRHGDGVYLQVAGLLQLSSITSRGRVLLCIHMLQQTLCTLSTCKVWGVLISFTIGYMLSKSRK